MSGDSKACLATNPGLGSRLGRANVRSERLDTIKR